MSKNAFPKCQISRRESGINQEREALLMKKNLNVIIIFLLLISCSEITAPVRSQEVKAIAVSDHTLFVQSYELPKGIFRGVLWPTEDAQWFEIWIIKNRKEIFFNIPPPSGFANYKNEVTKDWEINLSKVVGNKVVYFARRKDGKKIIEVELPVKKRKYTFSVLKNAVEEEILIFMDISEDIADKGLFGYVTVKDN
ncbi:MAG: hypothetical protein GY795_37600 [Desulfobacterales bacterium]|nr:hypothetical protein [Desulfobacterales bacterium]